MTLLSALRCTEGIVITTDSRETSGASRGRVAQSVTKLWQPRTGFLLAWAGFKNVAQAFALAMQREEGLSPSLDRLEIEKRLLGLLKQIRDDSKTDYAEWLIAWWSVPDKMPVALRLTSTGTTQWTEEWEHAGDERPIDIARQIAGSLRFVPRDTLTIEQAKVIALKVMRDTIHVGVESIGGDAQLGAVTRRGVEIVTGADLRPARHARRVGGAGGGAAAGRREGACREHNTGSRHPAAGAVGSDLRRCPAGRRSLPTMSAPPNPCPTCNGTGWVKTMTIPSQPLQWRECQGCLGTGSITQKGEKLLRPAGP